jgi:ABC-type nickel/cobalt efflux system permease component RcnA
MESLGTAIQQGTVSALVLLPTALLLGALHGLEPGHSKTMMAAFIIAARGTVQQAVLLGLSAAFSHVIIVWVLALAALTWGEQLSDERTEPWLLLASGVIILLVAAWMFRSAWRDAAAANDHDDYTHDHDHHHNHSHEQSHRHDHDHPDAHSRYHARQIEKKFSGRPVTTGQVVLFGLTGGLLPCAAAVTVLIVCLHLQKFWLGVAMVGAFSVGLALTLVTVGVVVAWGAGQAARRFSGLDRWSRRLPFLSTVLVALIGVFMLASGWAHLP